ncbi:MAG TPA: hypothetical protein VM689_10720 [Aliidongia sp.]|nr:hypothetical protein [Aliidongia sp.]
MTRIAFLSALLVAFAGTAHAQTPQQTEPPPIFRNGPIVNGKNLQPHLTPGEKEQDPEAANHLLQFGAHDQAAQSPIVVPRDIYGNPLGGNPGLNPPGLTPQQQASPKP